MMHLNLSNTMLLAAWLTLNARALPYPSGGSRNAIYFMTNEAENAVVAIPIGSDGKLSGGIVTQAGGAGSNSIDGATNRPAVPDPLIGQSALAVAGRNVFAVNAGSNTLSMLAVDKNDPTKLTMIGRPVQVQGEFPNTVAVSRKLKLACVGTTGAVNGVSCANFSPRGLGQFDQLRPFGLDQKTPPIGPTNSVSQLFFSDDESALFATVKGDPAVNNTGFFSTFPVVPGKGKRRATVANQDIRSSPNGTAVLFGSAVIPGTSSVFATDASFGGTVLTVDSQSGEAVLTSRQAIEDQVATCWVTISLMTRSAYVTDVARNRVVEMSVSDASILGETDLSETGAPGLIDLRAAGNHVYALSPGNGTTPAAVSVLDVSGGPGNAALVQNFDVSFLG